MAPDNHTDLIVDESVTDTPPTTPALPVGAGFTAQLRTDEDGAETAEIIMALVIFTIGMMAAWAYLRDVLRERVTAVADCISDAAEESSC